MLYGKKEVQSEILEQVRQFEKKNNKKVVFGAMVGSISKGAERYDSDYDTRFLYLDPLESGFIRWDKIEGCLEERQIHFCYIPEKLNDYVMGDNYREKYCEYAIRDKSFFYDKIAFWELTSFINFLKYPKLDNRFSVGLYHIVSWTFNSPFCWDPYGIASKISCLIDEMFVLEYEIQYYRNYIVQTLKKNPVKMREYLYSAYYALSIEYCLKNHRFAPVYFKPLLAMCSDESLKKSLLNLQEEYDHSMKMMTESEAYVRKMVDSFSISKDYVIDRFLRNVLDETSKYCDNNYQQVNVDYVDEIIGIIFDSLKRPIVRDVND